MADTDMQDRRLLRVLVIDDDVTTLACFEEMLVAGGYIVRALSTVKAGLADAAAHPPDAVLLDLHLPLTDGLECLRQLRAGPLSLTVPVAILTGDYFIDDRVVAELHSLGARIHFKPVWEDDLYQIVQELVRPPAGQLR